MIKSYKYRTGQAALRSLSEGSLYFAPAEQLNDVLEAKFDLADPKSFIETIYSGLNEVALSRRVPAQFESPKYSSKELDKEICQENIRFYEACQKVGIFSSTMRPDNQPLWAYYASDFNGICFELEWSKEVLERYSILPSDVSYEKGHRLHNRAEAAKRCLIKVGNENPGWSISKLMEYSLSEEFRRQWGLETISRALSVKHQDWAHEQEIRLITPRSGSLPILNDVLKRVFYVSREFPEWVSIVRLVHQLYPGVELVNVTFSHKYPFVRYSHVDLKKVPIHGL